MTKNKSDQWWDVTWNPVSGCSKISPGCLNCYCLKMFGRKLWDYDETVQYHEDRLFIPSKWKKPRKIFTCSMGDLFHKDVSGAAIAAVLETIFMTPKHTYMILTKRAKRMKASMKLLNIYNKIIPNLWLGVTVEHPDYLYRIEDLLKTPAAVRFVSVEPMLEEIVFNRVDLMHRGIPGISWIVCGSETGPGKRPMELDWARSLRDQCVESGVPFFFKKDSNGNHELDGRVWEEFPELAEKKGIET